MRLPSSVYAKHASNFEFISFILHALTYTPRAMAPTRTSSDDNKYAVPSLEEIIFSCGICQATVSELYPASEDNPASHSDDDDGMGTKLWIGNCVHVFCGRHVDGGGEFSRYSWPLQARADYVRNPFPLEQRPATSRVSGLRPPR